MSQSSRYEEYEGMDNLTSTQDWQAWVRFQKHRVEFLKNKTVNLVRANKILEAQNTVAIMDDIKKQIQLFINRKSDLENELTIKKED